MDRSPDARQDSLDPHLVETFEREVIHQWDFASRGIAMMNAVLKGQSQDTGAFWFGLDAALGALGNISKVFWPTGQARSETLRRCEQMRTEYGIPDDSLLRSRKARDGMEHFDERIDKWFRLSVRKNFADQVIAAPGMIVGLDPVDYARHFDPTTNVVTVSGDAIDFQALVAEVDEIVSAVRARVQQRRPGWGAP